MLDLCLDIVVLNTLVSTYYWYSFDLIEGYRGHNYTKGVNGFIGKETL